MRKKPFCRNFLIISLLFSFLSCTENKESPIVIFLSPEESVIEVNSNEHILFTIDSRATQGNITKITITKQDEYTGVENIIDSTVYTPTFIYSLDFIIPQYPDSSEILLIVTVYDNLGNIANSAKRLVINKGSSLITESSGNIMYSSLSGKPNAFNLKNMIPGYASDLFDADIDFMDNSIDSINGNEMSKTWISKNGLNFLKYNGFNYALANSLMISSSYLTGIRLSKITDLEESDIILVGRNETPIGAIQIISITDSDSTLNDKYVFNIKIIDASLQ